MKYILECHKTLQVYKLCLQKEHRGELTLLVDWTNKQNMIDYFHAHKIDTKSRNITMRITNERIKSNVLPTL